ncbi:TPA: hypothetical protein ACRNDL_001248 [Pseudomonas aeruginosa]|uniref:hypothetical protein n=1 Tax=Pseudomonas aeruginosa TaxID=287 RepID=UPI0008FB873B|nr:hypothetical protein [Pseudomonas aeruginosa]MDY1356771.1 hypothetical protein [Pseudomonas aeruginosa]HCF5159408.1 hypothetical protein [Pseudomonas aeruginosa]HCF7238184.1 hypothetical protein [Pseudomonas aeruginosa]
MEDYGKAFDSRRADVEILLAGENPRATAAAHLGGVAVECKLKALVIKYHGITLWGENSSRAKDSRRGQPIERPGHGLVASLRLMQQIHSKAVLDPRFLSHLSRIMHPAGATERDFIDLRYSGYELAGGTLSEWRESLEYVLGWLEKNGEK